MLDNLHVLPHGVKSPLVTGTVITNCNNSFQKDLFLFSTVCTFCFCFSAIFILIYMLAPLEMARSFSLTPPLLPDWNISTTNGYETFMLPRGWTQLTLVSLQLFLWYLCFWEKCLNDVRLKSGWNHNHFVIILYPVFLLQIQIQALFKLSSTLKLWQMTVYKQSILYVQYTDYFTSSLH